MHMEARKKAAQLSGAGAGFSIKKAFKTVG